MSALCWPCRFYFMRCGGNHASYGICCLGERWTILASNEAACWRTCTRSCPRRKRCCGQAAGSYALMAFTAISPAGSLAWLQTSVPNLSRYAGHLAWQNSRGAMPSVMHALWFLSMTRCGIRSYLANQISGLSR